mgnify:CR=1 FL=1
MHSDETKRKISISVTKYHKENPRTSDTRKKIGDKMRAAYDRGDSIGFKKGNIGGSMRTREGIDKSLKACRGKCLGAHGFGRMERGRKDHIMAKSWVVESTNGDSYKIENLLEWCRFNSELFGDDSTELKIPAWRRAYLGLAGKGKWYNWVANVIQ